MNPEAKDAIRIADKHLAGQSTERRCALAKDIMEACIRHASTIATAAIREAFDKAKKPPTP